ncbi:unnamed protein product [Caenorhabditis sp. 36 PRJEB53466]|nr:unnamed protein product [Caenorhabditis sp. 36 PRJEB53466]
MGELMVDLVYTTKGGVLVNHKCRRLTFDKDKHCLVFRSPSDLVTKFCVTQFVLRKIKVPTIVSGKHVILSLELDRDHPDNHGSSQLKVKFEPPHANMVEYVAKEFSDMLEANKDKLKKKPRTEKPKDVWPPSSLLHEDPFASRSVFNKKSCQKEGERRKVLKEKQSDVSRRPTPVPPLSRVATPSTTKAQVPTPTLKRNERNETFRRENVKPMYSLMSETGPLIPSIVVTMPSAEPTPLPSPETVSRPISRQEGSDTSVRSENLLKLPSTHPKRNPIKASTPSTPTYQKKQPAPLQKPAMSMTPPTPRRRKLNSKDAGCVEYPENRKLANPSNSCYFNATMQALSVCIPFLVRSNCLLRRFEHQEYKDTWVNLLRRIEWRKEGDKDRYTSVLQQFLLLMNTLGAREYAPFGNGIYLPAPFKEEELRALRYSIGAFHKPFSEETQQDAHEFLLVLLNIINDVMVLVAKRDNVTLNNDLEKCLFGTSICGLNPAAAFQMEVQTRYVCQMCEYEAGSETQTRFDLGVEISQGLYVQEMLSSCVKWTAMKRKCPNCGHGVFSTSDRVVSLPQCLILNLKRYEHVNKNFRKKKCTVNLSFSLKTACLRSTQVKHPELERTEEDERDSAIPAEDKENDDNDENSVHGLNGGSDRHNSSLVVEKELVVEPYRFELLTDKRQITEILKVLHVKPLDAALDQHLEQLRALPTGEIDKLDQPDRLQTIEMDGNCFYRAVSWCLTGKETHHKRIRAKLVEFMEIKKKSFEMYCEDYDAHMDIQKVPGEWATATEIIAFATLCNVDVYTRLPDRWVLTQPKDLDEGDEKMSTKSCGSIYLNNTALHYEPVITIKSNRRRMKQQRRNEEESDEEDGPPASKKRNKDDEEYRPTQDSATRPRHDRKRKRSDEKGDPLSSPTVTELEKARAPCPSPSDYQLVAVICHEGEEPGSGHYVAYTKEFSCNAWKMCSDTTVESSSVEQVAERAGKEGYVLFYTRQTSPFDF